MYEDIHLFKMFLSVQFFYITIHVPLMSLYIVPCNFTYVSYILIPILYKVLSVQSPFRIKVGFSTVDPWSFTNISPLDSFFHIPNL